MLDFFLDGRPLGPAANVADALREARTLADASGRMIVDASLDGKPVPAGMLASDHPGSASHPVEGSRFNFLSARPGDVARSALEAAADALTQVKPGHKAAADAVRDGDLEPAMDELGRVLSTWDKARAALEGSAQLLGIGPGTDQWGPISAAVASLGGRLADIKTSLVSRDWAGLADVLEYDMDRQADSVAEVLRGFARTAAAR
jgi:hypothetical protein